MKKEKFKYGWTNKDKEYLIKQWGKLSVNDIAKKLRKKTGSIYSYATGILKLPPLSILKTEMENSGYYLVENSVLIIGTSKRFSSLRELNKYTLKNPNVLNTYKPIKGLDITPIIGE